MKNTLIISMLLVFLVGCSAKMPLNQVQPVGDFFGYQISNDPIPMIGLGGTFVWQNDCLLFKTEDNELATPLLPAQYTKFKRGDAGVTMGQKFYPLNTFSMMGGDVDDIKLSQQAQAKLISQASPNCIMDKTTIIY